MPARTTFADDFQPDFGLLWKPKPREVVAAMAPEELQRYLQARKKADEYALKNPVGSGWILPSWKLVMDNWRKYPVIVILGGIRSSKSTLASRLLVWTAATIPEAECRAYHVNDERSVEQQQFIWDALPEGIKNLPTKKGIHHSVQYSQKNGFTDNICIVPPVTGYRKGGTIKFGNYAQYKQDAQVTEGFKSHAIWLDEEAPVKMFETLIYRTTDYHGRIIMTFTTLSGWTSLIQDILGKTKTLKTAYAPLLRQEVPVMQESLSRPGAVIYYFHTADNAFIDVADFTSKVKSRSKAEIAARAYGIPTKSLAGAFPLFSREVNVIPHEQLPWIKDKKYKVTRYMGLDPGGSKNWFMLWVAIDAAGTWWVYREWPDFDDWALPGNKPGPATKSLGYGIKDYVELIKDIEKDGAVYERVIDPRLGAAEKQAEEGATTIITQLDDQDMTFIPAPAASSDVNKGEIEDGIQLISDLLAYRQDKPRDAVNSPHLYVSDRCQNFIYAMQEYTGKLGTTEATKDPCDCFDAETEVLTEDGWAPFPTLERGKKVATMAKDGYLEFQTPTEYHDYEYSGPMISVKSESLDFKVTPNHRMLVYPQRPYLKIREAKNLYRQDTVPVTTLGIRDSLSHTVELWPGKIVSAEDWAEFMGWYVSEGSVDGSNGGNLNRPSMGVYISQSETANLEKFDLIGQVIGRLGFRGKPRATGWAIYNYDLWCLLAPLGAQSERYIPREVMNLPRNCLEKLWAAMVLGDGWRQGIYGHYASISTRLIEDTSELLSRLGRPYGGVYVRSMDVLGGEIKGRPVVPTMPLMMFGEKKRRVASLTTKTKEMLVKTEEYAGRVYCVSVPNETLLVRRNWKPLVAGNCLRYLRKANCMFLEEQPPDKGSTGVY